MPNRLSQPTQYRGKLQAVIPDWAGTAGDFGSLGPVRALERVFARAGDRKSTRLNSSHGYISYVGFCLKKKNLINWPRSAVHHIFPDAATPTAPTHLEPLPTLGAAAAPTAADTHDAVLLDHIASTPHDY